MQEIPSRPSLLKIALAWGPMTIAISMMSGCGFHWNVDPAAISAASNIIRVNQTLQLNTEIGATGVPVTFYVNGIAGGNATLGTVNSNGLYTAPAIVPSPNNVTITSSTPSYPKEAGGSVALTVLNPIPIVTSLNPSPFSEGTTTVTINGSQFLYGAQIFWNGAAVQTTFVSNTELAASIAAPNPGTYTLAVDNPSPGPANSAAFPVIVKPGQVVLTLQTNADTSVRVGNSVNFPLTVAGTNNTGVTLQVNGVAGGNAQVGIAVSNTDGSITYTAPLVVPTPNNVVQVTLTSVDNPTVTLAQNIEVMNPIPILTAANPITFNTGPATVVLTGSNFISGAQLLMNGVAVPTTFNSGGQLTANLNLTEPGNLDLQVLNPSPGPATSADLIGLVNGTPPVPVVSPQDASRFLQQATFGATDADIRNVSNNGFQAWLNNQFAMPPTLHEPYVEQALILNNPPCAAGDAVCNAALFVQNDTDEAYVQQSFWQQAISGNDQLRQRIKYALSEIFVISSNNSPAVANMPRGEAAYLDLLGADAFGNFRQLLQDVTLNPMMGQFLSLQGNDKGDATRDPDENYAREVMQLLTIGLYQLNPDGTQQLNGSGQPIPTYSNNDVMGLAAVFTGFSWNVPGNTGDTAWGGCCIYVGPGYGEDLLPLQSYPNHHSTEEKDFLGVTIPASGSADPNGDLKIALDTLFNHPNLPPFFCRQLIEHLVTSNPSPAYVSRVAAVFQNDGTGVRGNLQAVIQAILLDEEARNSASATGNPQYGKVRESLVRYAEWARAFTAQSRSGSYNLGSTEDPIWGLGEMTLRSPTVFNWFAPGYVPPGTSIAQAGLDAPEMQMTDVSTVVGYLNYLQGAIGSNAQGGADLFSSYATEMSLAANPDALLDRLNLLLMAGQMDDTLRSHIISAVSAIPIPASGQDQINAALANRVMTAVYLTMAAPSYSSQI
jgi:uncharacterized protein (DUF1800 family)